MAVRPPSLAHLHFFPLTFPPAGWSAPSFISPNNLTVGLLAGLDLYDAILILRTQAAVDSFATHKVTLGGEMALAAGPYGSGISIESGIDKSPVLSYVRTRCVLPTFLGQSSFLN